MRKSRTTTVKEDVTDEIQVEQEAEIRKLRLTEVYEDVAVEIQVEQESTKVKENGLVFFERHATKAVLDAIDAYRSGVALNIQQYVRLLKKRRDEMLALRNSGGAR